MENRITHAAISDVKITSGLLGRVSRLVKEQVLPYQWDILNDVAKDAVIFTEWSSRTVTWQNGWKLFRTD